jgi:hypothetical protein
MNTQKRSTLVRAGGHEAPAGSSRWAASLKHKRVHYRCIDVVTPEGSFVVEYRGQGMGNEQVLVDGQVAARGHSTWWYTPRFSFRIGTTDAVLAVHFWPWLTLRWLRLIVGGRSVYSEGSAGQELSVEDLLAVLTDPLASEGIQVDGKPMTVPTNVVCDEQAGHITLTQRWFSWIFVLMVPVCVLLDAAIVGTYALMPKGDLALAVLLLLLPGILLALWASYYILAKLVNRTVVRVTTSGLSIRHGPLPWPGNQDHPIKQVRKFCCRLHVNRNYAGDVWKTYTLSAILENGRQVDLLRKIGSPGAASILEQQVTNRLAAA